MTSRGDDLAPPADFAAGQHDMNAVGPAGPAPVGVIAGRGRLPVEIAAGVRREGRPVVCVDAFDADPGLAEVSDAHYTVALGELGAMVDVLRRHAVREVVLAGKVDKLVAAGRVRLDALGLRVAGSLPDLRDASILQALVGVLEEHGFTVESQARYVAHLVARAGVLGARAPSAEEAADIAFGARIAAGVAALDLGQAVAVRRRIVLAVEAAEGTDAMIRRAGALAAGAVVVKVSRPRQDPRYDLPAVGPRTIETLAGAGAVVLAVEAGRTLLLERERMIASADDAHIAVAAVAVAPAGPGARDR